MIVEPSSSRRAAFSRWAALVVAALLLFYALLILIESIIFLAGGRLQSTVVPVALAAAILFYLVVGRKSLKLERKALLAGLAAILLFSTAASLFSSYMIDLSWDGRDYQQRAIRRLAEGWNPVYTELQPADLYYNAWLNHYPRATWIASAALFTFTGNVEVGKVFNLLLMAAVFLAGLATLLLFPRLSVPSAVLLSLALAANPVSVYQSMSYYVDGQVSSIFILLGLLMLLALKRHDWAIWTALACAALVGLNIKFTGTVYVVTLLAALALVHWIVKPNLKAQLPLWAALAAGCLLGVFVVGFNPYVTNLMNYGHPFYPIYGSQELNQDYIVGQQMPSNFRNKSQLRKLYLSVFSRSQNTYNQKTGPLKNPFSVSLAEIKTFKQVDVRVGGWGPLFGAMLILAGGVLALALLEWKGKLWVPLGLIVLVFGTALLNPEVWWARYSPQLWLVPLVAAAAALFCSRRVIQAAGMALLAVSLINLSLVTGAYFTASFSATRQVRLTLEQLSQSGRPIEVYYGALDAVTTKLDEYNIPYPPMPSLESLHCPKELEPDNFYSGDCSKGFQ
ncbi:MAG TPA: hypothetical protein VF498_01660 [Anaerolineales bacterium]